MLDTSYLHTLLQWQQDSSHAFISSKSDVIKHSLQDCSTTVAGLLNNYGSAVDGIKPLAQQARTEFCAFAAVLFMHAGG
jgi:hypothetical protein